MTDHIAFLIDCLRKGSSFYWRRSCTQLLNIKSSTCTTGSGVGGPFSLDIITPCTGIIGFPTALGIPTASCVIITWCGLGCGGRGRSGGCLGTLLSSQSRLMVHCGLSFCAGIYAPVAPSHSFPELDIAWCRNGRP